MAVPIPAPVLPTYRIPIAGVAPAPVPLVAPVPVIPGNAAFAAPAPAAVANAGATITAAPAAVDQAVSAPATGEAPNPRPNLRRAGEFLRRPKVRNGITDFLTGATAETTGGPVAAFLTGFAGAWGSGLQREQAQAAAAAEAEQLEYNRGRDSREDALAESRLGLDAARLEHDRTNAERDDVRATAVAEAGIYKTAAEIAEITRRAEQVLSSAQIIDIETRASEMVTDLVKNEAGGWADEGQMIEFQRRANEWKAGAYQTLINAANGVLPTAGAAATGATPPPATFTPPPGVTGDGTRAAPYSGPLTNEIIAAIPITDPPQLYVVGGVVYERRAVP